MVHYISFKKIRIGGYMKTNLQKFVIDGVGISNDLYGKQGAIYELNENKTELTINSIKLVSIVLLTLAPLLLSLFLTILYGINAGWSFGDMLGALVGVGIVSLLITAFWALPVLNWSEDTYKKSRASITELWDRRRELNRFIHVGAELYDNSQGREIAPLLLARIRKHNRMIGTGSRMIALQETLDRNSESKLAKQLEQSISEKVKAEYNDLLDKLESYEIMKEMRADMPLDITAALMDIEDLNKSDLDAFLTEKQEAMKLLLDDRNDSEEGFLPIA
jgi:hypothetical protein